MDAAETAVGHDEDAVAGPRVADYCPYQCIEIVQAARSAAKRREHACCIPAEAGVIDVDAIRKLEARRKRVFHHAALHGVRAGLEDREDAALPYSFAQPLQRDLDRGRVMREI